MENNKSKSNNQHICVMLMLHNIDIVSHSRHSTTFKEHLMDGLFFNIVKLI